MRRSSPAHRPIRRPEAESRSGNTGRSGGRRALVLDWSTMTDTHCTLFRGGRVHNPAEPNATCIAVEGGLVSWIGPDTGIEQAGRVDEVVDLDGLFVAPAFVDAHVHTTDAGLAGTGLDLRTAPSLEDLLTRLRGFAADHRGAVVWAHGWDQ